MSRYYDYRIHMRKLRKLAPIGIALFDGNLEKIAYLCKQCFVYVTDCGYINAVVTVYNFELKPSFVLHMEIYDFSQIAAELGYETPSYFSKVFKKFAGMTPTEYSKYVSKCRVIK